MAMKESVGSLRAYFIVVALLGLWGVSSLFDPQQRAEAGILLLVLTLFNVLLSAAYLYVGLSLPKLLASSPRMIINIIIANTVVAIVIFLLHLTAPSRAVAAILLLVTLAINWYLYKNVTRLSREALPK